MTKVVYNLSTNEIVAFGENPPAGEGEAIAILTDDNLAQYLTLCASIINGEIVWDNEKLSQLMAGDLDTTVFVDITLSGGDGRNDPIGLLNDGIDAVHVVATIKDRDGNTVPVTMPFRVELRRENGEIYDIVLVNVVNGVAEFDYKTTLPPALVYIDEKDLVVGEGLIAKLSRPVKVKIYRRLI